METKVTRGGGSMYLTPQKASAVDRDRHLLGAQDLLKTGNISFATLLQNIGDSTASLCS